jgi:hypothetical protein
MQGSAIEARDKKINTEHSLEKFEVSLNVHTSLAGVAGS